MTAHLLAVPQGWPNIFSSPPRRQRKRIRILMGLRRIIGVPAPIAQKESVRRKRRQAGHRRCCGDGDRIEARSYQKLFHCLLSTAGRAGGKQDEKDDHDDDCDHFPR
jgi:hypothetical protein